MSRGPGECHKRDRDRDTGPAGGCRGADRVYLPGELLTISLPVCVMCGNCMGQRTTCISRYQSLHPSPLTSSHPHILTLHSPPLSIRLVISVFSPKNNFCSNKTAVGGVVGGGALLWESMCGPTGPSPHTHTLTLTFSLPPSSPQTTVDGSRLVSELTHCVARPTGFDAVMRVRASTGEREGERQLGLPLYYLRLG